MTAPQYLWPTQWYNVLCACLESGWSWVLPPVTSNQNYLCCFSTKHTALRSKSNDGLTRWLTQDNAIMYAAHSFDFILINRGNELV